MNRSSILVKISRILQKLPIGFLRVFEWPFLSKNQDEKVNMIILLAPPRSGSTLTYQTLCHALDSYYLSNASLLLYKLPFFGALLSGLLCKNHKSTFRSRHGLVAGLCGPAEGLRFWEFWFGCGLDETQTQMTYSEPSTKKRRCYLKKVLWTLGKPHRPVITGYLGHAICTKKMMAEFSEAIYIVLRRNPIDNALSILNSNKYNGSKWFSIKPKECDNHEDDELRRVASQVYWINKKLDNLEGNNILSVSYEELCDKPNRLIGTVVNFCNLRGLKLKQKEALPKCFMRKEPVGCVELELLAKEFKELQVRHGELSVYKQNQYELSVDHDGAGVQ